MELARPTAIQVGELYDEATDLLVAAMGGNIHLGYWDDERDQSPIERATDRLTDLVGARLQVTAGQRVLDVGCGTGRPAARISAAHRVHVTGITVSAHQLDLAGRLAPPAAGSTEFVLADAMSPLPFADASFDAAYAIESLLHLSDLAAALEQISRVLRPSGRLVIADAYLRDRPDDVALAVITRMGAQFRFASLPTRRECAEQLAAAGLTQVDFADIREHVQRTYRLTANAVCGAAHGLDAEHAEHAAALTATARLLEQFGSLRQIGYMLVTASR